MRGNEGCVQVDVYLVEKREMVIAGVSANCIFFLSIIIVILVDGFLTCYCCYYYDSCCYCHH